MHLANSKKCINFKKLKIYHNGSDLNTNRLFDTSCLSYRVSASDANLFLFDTQCSSNVHLYTHTLVLWNFVWKCDAFFLKQRQSV